MNIVKSIASIALLSLVVAAPSVRAGADECVIDAIQWGKIFTPDDNAIPAIDAGIKPIQTIFGISVDAGYFGPAFALFELPQFKGPVLFGKLRVDVERAWGYELGEAPTNCRLPSTMSIYRFYQSQSGLTRIIMIQRTTLVQAGYTAIFLYLLKNQMARELKCL